MGQNYLLDPSSLGNQVLLVDLARRLHLVIRGIPTGEEDKNQHLVARLQGESSRTLHLPLSLVS